MTVLQCEDIYKIFKEEKICCPLCHRHDVYGGKLGGNIILKLCCTGRRLLDQKIEQLGCEEVVRLLDCKQYIVDEQLIRGGKVKEVSCAELDKNFPKLFPPCCEPCHKPNEPSSKLKHPLVLNGVTFKVCCNKRNELEAMSIAPDTSTIVTIVNRFKGYVIDMVEI